MLLSSAVGRRLIYKRVYNLLVSTQKRTRRTQIVAIGAAIDSQELSDKFDACIEQF